MYISLCGCTCTRIQPSACIHLEKMYSACVRNFFSTQMGKNLKTFLNVRKKKISTSWYIYLRKGCDRKKKYTLELRILVGSFPFLFFSVRNLILHSEWHKSRELWHSEFLRDQPVYQYHDKHPVRYLQLLETQLQVVLLISTPASAHKLARKRWHCCTSEKLSHCICIQVHLRILLTGPYRKKKWCDNDPPTIGCQKSKLCVSFSSKAFPTSSMHLCHPLHRIADTSAVPVEGRRTWVPGLRFPFAVCKIIKCVQIIYSEKWEQLAEEVSGIFIEGKYGV